MYVYTQPSFPILIVDQISANSEFEYKYTIPFNFRITHIFQYFSFQEGMLRYRILLDGSPIGIALSKWEYGDYFFGHGYPLDLYPQIEGRKGTVLSVKGKNYDQNRPLTLYVVVEVEKI